MKEEKRSRKREENGFTIGERKERAKRDEGKERLKVSE